MSIFQIDPQSGVPKLLHKTEVPGLPSAMCSFLPKADAHRLLVAVGDTVVLYQLGPLQLLRQASSKRFPTIVKFLSSRGSRIYAGDLGASVHVLLYDDVLNSFYMFARDISSRWLTAFLVLDYDTVLIGDKFGNIVALRVPESVSARIDADTTRLFASKLHNLEVVARFHIGQVVIALQMTQQAPGTPQSVVYVTVLGHIGTLTAITSHRDAQFLRQLEAQMRKLDSPLSGLAHIKYRSVYGPVCNVIDGDLCARFHSLTHEKVEQIVDEVEHSKTYIAKKLHFYSSI